MQALIMQKQERSVIHIHGMISLAPQLEHIHIAILTVACTLNALGRFTVSTQDAINALTDQLVKAQLEAAGVAEQIDLSSLTAAAQALDDIVPDPAPAA